MTTTYLTEEPPDGTILATPDLTYAFSRNDAEAAAGNRDDRNWYPVNGDDDPINWSEMNALGAKWQRLYRQSDVDAQLAEARTKLAEEIAQAIEDDSLGGECSAIYYRLADIARNEGKAPLR